MNALTRRPLFGRVGMFGSRVVASGVRHTALALALALPAATWMIIAGAVPDASAASAACSPSSHCWAEYENLNTSTNRGIYGSVNVHCLYQPRGDAFVTSEIWDANDSGNFEEVGLFSGYGAGSVVYGNKNWFWGDYRPSDMQVNEHDSTTTASADTNYRMKIEYEGSNTWYLYGKGDYSHFGTSSSQTATLIHGEAGTEYTSGSGSAIRDVGQVGDLQRISSDNTWFHWGDNAGRYANGYITPTYNSSQLNCKLERAVLGQWLVTADTMDTPKTRGEQVCRTVSCAGHCGTEGRPPTWRRASPWRRCQPWRRFPPAQVRGRAGRFLRQRFRRSKAAWSCWLGMKAMHTLHQSGQSSPPRTRRCGTATPGDLVPGSAGKPVYLVVMTGNFKDTNFPMPPGTHIPTAHYLAVTVNPATFRVMDLGLGDHKPPVPLRSYGQVSNLMGE